MADDSLDFGGRSAYTLQREIGKGSSSQVVLAQHNESGTQVAIKTISLTEDRGNSFRRLLREIRLLKHFRDHRRIVKTFEILQIVANARSPYPTVWLVQEIFVCDLRVMLNGHRDQILPEPQSKHYLHQLLEGISALHSVNIMHRDLKPANLLLDRNHNLKICDLGLARWEPLPVLIAEPTHLVTVGAGVTVRAGTHSYMAPEVHFSKSYTKACDLWSFGCILAELIQGEALFTERTPHGKHASCDFHRLIGSDTSPVFKVILAKIGRPSAEVINDFKRGLTPRQAESVDSRLALLLEQVTPAENLDKDRICPNASTEAFDLIRQCLTLSGSGRISVQDATDHPYFQDRPRSTDATVPSSAMPIPAERFDFEGNQSSEQLKALIQEEIEQHDPNRIGLTVNPQTTLDGTSDWLPVLTFAEFRARNPPSPAFSDLSSLSWHPTPTSSTDAQSSSDINQTSSSYSAGRPSWSGTHDSDSAQ